MYRIALPKLPVDDIVDASLEHLTQRDSKMFFPRKAVEAILNMDTIREVLECNGESCCRRGRENNLADFEVLVPWVFNHAQTLLAVLIYLGHTAWINYFSKGHIGDDNLDRVITFIDETHPAGLSPGFVRSYQNTLDLFRPAIFVMGEPRFAYQDHQRFPYIKDEFFQKGSFGEVRRFEIHPDYLDSSLAKVAEKYSHPSALVGNSSSPSAVFARKILKYTLDKSDFDMEIQVLQIIDQQNHTNIIDLVAFYSWRGELNCVFPFVATNLDEVLHTDWKPESMAATARFPKHWLWEQMRLVADALQTIHHPPIQPRPDLGTIVGFHFDLKPKNILVTPDGILKITDFGQSMIKMVEEKEYAYGTYVGGDFAYGPPEVAPSRNEIKELRATAFSPSLQSSCQSPDSATTPFTASRTPSSSASRVGSQSSRSQSSNKSFRARTGSLRELGLGRRASLVTSVYTSSSAQSEVPKVTATANYDVWSLACIMTEVLVFIFEGGASAVKDFERLRKEELRDLSFHNGKQGEDCLKKCVKKKFHDFRVLDHPDAVTTPGQPRSYLSDVVGLLESMFRADPSQRLSSEQVVDQLETIDTNHKEDHDPDSDILRFMRNLGPMEGFKELGYWSNGGVVPFYIMPDIKIEINPSSIVACRLQLFRKGGAVHVRIRYGHQFINDLSHTFDNDDSFFCPIYLFDPSKPYVCCLKDKNIRRILHFGSDEGLLVFQAAIMRHYPRRGIRISEVSLQPNGRGIEEENYKRLHDPGPWGRCQVWQAEDPQYVNAGSPPVLSARQNTPKSVILFFFSPKSFFGIPLLDGKKTIREKQDSFKEDVKRVVIERSGGYNQHFHFIKSTGPGFTSARNEVICPAIPLSSRWLKHDEAKRASKVDILFPSNSDLDRFKKEIGRTNKANPVETQRIPWKDASSPQARSPGIFKSHTFN